MNIWFEIHMVSFALICVLALNKNSFSRDYNLPNLFFNDLCSLLLFLNLCFFIFNLLFLNTESMYTVLSSSSAADGSTISICALKGDMLGKELLKIFVDANNEFLVVVNAIVLEKVGLDIDDNNLVALILGIEANPLNTNELLNMVKLVKCSGFNRGV